MIRIEEVGDINSDFPYLEVFLKDNTAPFLDIGIIERKLSFKFYASSADVSINVEELERILSVAKFFLTRALKNEDDFLDLIL